MVVGYPLVRLVTNSFQDFGLRALFTGNTRWIGLANYGSVLSNPSFQPVIIRTAIFTTSLVVGCILTGLWFAELMTRINKLLLTVFNIVLILTWAMPSVTSTLLWMWLFQPLYGVLNWIITRVGWFGDYTAHSWISSPGQAFFIMWLLIVWESVPFVALTLYAGRSQIPKEYYEAAQLDGARAWAVFRSITLPFLSPILYLVAILSTIWNLNSFNQIWILTQGGPAGGTTTLSVWTYQTAFASNSFGQGSAIAVMTTMLLVVITIFYVRRLTRTEAGM